MQDNQDDSFFGLFSQDEELDRILKKLIDENAISMGWSDEEEDFMFWMDEDQQARHDLAHPG